MGATVTTANTNENTWGGGNEPMGASYGKLMMWFFIVSDALTFSGFLAAYGFSRFKFIDNWHIGFVEVGTALGFLGLFLWSTFRELSKAALIPKNHPMLPETLHHRLS